MAVRGSGRRNRKRKQCGAANLSLVLPKTKQHRLGRMKEIKKKMKRRRLDEFRGLTRDLTRGK